MPTVKNLGTVPLSETKAGTFIERTCIIIHFASGLVCLTNHPCSEVTLNLDGVPKNYNAVQLNLDGTPRWFLNYNLTLGEITEATSDGRSASWLQFGNLAASNNFQDRQITKWANSPGLRGVAVDIYSVHFSPVNDSYLGSYLMYPAEFDGGEFGPIAQITIKPRDTPWASRVPHAKIEGKCAFLRQYKVPGGDCGYTGAEPAGELTCGGTAKNCADRFNLARNGGFYELPKPGREIDYP